MQQLTFIEIQTVQLSIKCVHFIFSTENEQFFFSVFYENKYKNICLKEIIDFYSSFLLRILEIWNKKDDKQLELFFSFFLMRKKNE